MEIAHIEFRPEGLLRAGAQLEELALAEHVSEGLRRIGEVAIDFARREILVQAALACHVRDGLVARPVVRMDAGIDDEPRGAKELGLQVPVVLEGILVEAEIEAELLRVERPALGVRHVPASHPAPRVELLHLRRSRDLHVVARYGFVHEERLGPPRRLVLVAERVDREVAAGAEPKRSGRGVGGRAAAPPGSPAAGAQAGAGPWGEPPGPLPRGPRGGEGGIGRPWPGWSAPRPPPLAAPWAGIRSR